MEKYTRSRTYSGEINYVANATTLECVRRLPMLGSTARIPKIKTVTIKDGKKTIEYGYVWVEKKKDYFRNGVSLTKFMKASAAAGNSKISIR